MFQDMKTATGNVCRQTLVHLDDDQALDQLAPAAATDTSSSLSSSGSVQNAGQGSVTNTNANSDLTDSTNLNPIPTFRPMPHVVTALCTSTNFLYIKSDEL